MREDIPYSKERGYVGEEAAWAGALHAKRVSSKWKVQRFHVRSQWLDLVQEGRKAPAQLPHVSQRMCHSWGTKAGAGGKPHWMP